jgi:hypothetical protein
MNTIEELNNAVQELQKITPLLTNILAQIYDTSISIYKNRKSVKKMYVYGELKKITPLLCDILLKLYDKSIFIHKTLKTRSVKEKKNKLPDNIMENIEDLVIKLTNNFTEIITKGEITNHPQLYWGGNGVGNRWAKKKFNYTVVYSSGKTKNYSENDDDIIPPEILKKNIDTNKGTGIIGIYVYSKRGKQLLHPIKPTIRKEIVKQSCVVCGSYSEIVCDHKNDLYNDIRVLNTKTQQLNDFQPLCNHCNLQKRQICKEETETQKIYSAKNIIRYKQYNFDFPWEKKAFDKTDPYCKDDTYWFDPVEFEKKIFLYIQYKLPILNAIKHRVKHNKHLIK